MSLAKPIGLFSVPINLEPLSEFDYICPVSGILLIIMKSKIFFPDNFFLYIVINLQNLWDFFLIKLIFLIMVNFVDLLE